MIIFNIVSSGYSSSMYDSYWEYNSLLRVMVNVMIDIVQSSSSSNGCSSILYDTIANQWMITIIIDT